MGKRKLLRGQLRGTMHLLCGLNVNYGSNAISSFFLLFWDFIKSQGQVGNTYLERVSS